MLVPDFLSLAYYAGNYDHKAPAELPMEMQDTYVRLDNSIAELLELIDRKVGLNNTLFFIPLQDMLTQILLILLNIKYRVENSILNVVLLC